MADEKIANLKTFSAYRDENGQGLSDNPADQARPDDVQAQLSAEPQGESEAARLASGFTGDDGTEATEIETPAENIAHISDATLPTRSETAAALDRATAGLGKES
ncbi:hypothetical protein [uncultured Enterovirga sp.]|uniref:hypothetical protein n=1 Tax=uncultured Enterovirga sp. TaxID=2026352 RepID=UPI0035CA5FCD